MKYPNCDLSKEELLEYGKSIISKFLQLNNINDVKKVMINNNIPVRGYYNHKEMKIVINMKKLRRCTKSPGFCWSYTGYKADITPSGVLLHEYAHFLDDLCGNLSAGFKRKTKGERVSSYEPTDEEAFAESFRVFVLNPDLLKNICPKRYGILIKSFKPVINDPWEKVLEHSHEKYKIAIKNLIKN